MPSLHAGAAAMACEEHRGRPGARCPGRGYRPKSCPWCRSSGGFLRLPERVRDRWFLRLRPRRAQGLRVDHYKLGLDVSLNQRAGSTSPGFWQLQLWGFFHEPKKRWRTQLKALLNPNGGVTRPVKVKKPTSLEAAAAYGLKSTFVRRDSYRKANLDREDRGECWNTRGRILRGEPGWS